MKISAIGKLSPNFSTLEEAKSRSRKGRISAKLGAAAQALKKSSCSQIYRLSAPVRHELFESAKRFIATPPLLQENLSYAENILRRLNKRDDRSVNIELWLAICGRLRGLDTTKSFLGILWKDPTNRLAQVNLAAAYLCCGASIEGTEIPRKIVDDLQCLIRKDEGDLFAKLLEALYEAHFFGNYSHSIEKLEQIYLRDISYTAAMTVMSVLLHRVNRNVTAADYATEAYRTEPLNFHSRFLSTEGENDPTPNFASTALSHVVFQKSYISLDAILYSAYSIQDRFFQ